MCGCGSRGSHHLAVGPCAGPDPRGNDASVVPGGIVTRAGEDTDRPGDPGREAGRRSPGLATRNNRAVGDPVVQAAQPPAKPPSSAPTTTAATAGTVAPVVETVAAPVAKAVAPVAQAVAVPVAKTVAPVAQGAVTPVAKTVAPIAQAAVEPVTETVAPAVQTVAPVVQTVAKPVAQTVAPVVQTVAKPVVQTVAPVVETVAKPVAPVAQSVAPVLQTAAPVVQAVAKPVAQVVRSVEPLVQTVAKPVEGSTFVVRTVLAAPVVSSSASSGIAPDPGRHEPDGRCTGSANTAAFGEHRSAGRNRGGGCADVRSHDHRWRRDVRDDSATRAPLVCCADAYRSARSPNRLDARWRAEPVDRRPGTGGPVAGPPARPRDVPPPRRCPLPTAGHLQPARRSPGSPIFSSPSPCCGQHRECRRR